MAEYTASAVQIVNPGEYVIFTETIVPCRRGFVRHRDGTSTFMLSGWLPQILYCCPCMRPDSAEYLVDFGANIAIPTGGTPGEISLALTMNGSTIPASIMATSPTAIEQYDSISKTISAEVWRNCCETIAVRNLSDQPIQIANPVIDLNRPDLVITR